MWVGPMPFNARSEPVKSWIDQVQDGTGSNPQTFHLLVFRRDDGFMWQVREGRYATVIEQASQPSPTQAEAEVHGSAALKQLRNAARP